MEEVKNMTDGEKRLQAQEIVNMIRNPEISNDEISEEMITWLLDLGVEIIRCFDLKENYVHPAVSFSRWLNFERVEYWRKRERDNNLDEVLRMRANLI